MEHHTHSLSFPVLPQTLQMGIQHFSGLFVLLCAGLGLSILTAIGEHIVYRLLLPRIKNKSRLQYWLHTSQVSVSCSSTPNRQNPLQWEDPEPQVRLTVTPEQEN